MPTSPMNPTETDNWPTTSGSRTRIGDPMSTTRHTDGPQHHLHLAHQHNAIRNRQPPVMKYRPPPLMHSREPIPKPTLHPLPSSKARVTPKSNNALNITQSRTDTLKLLQKQLDTMVGWENDIDFLPHQLSSKSGSAAHSLELGKSSTNRERLLRNSRDRGTTKVRSTTMMESRSLKLAQAKNNTKAKKDTHNTTISLSNLLKQEEQREKQDVGSEIHCKPTMSKYVDVLEIQPDAQQNNDNHSGITQTENVTTDMCCQICKSNINTAVQVTSLNFQSKVDAIWLEFTQRQQEFFKVMDSASKHFGDLLSSLRLRDYRCKVSNALTEIEANPYVQIQQQQCPNRPNNQKWFTDEQSTLISNHSLSDYRFSSRHGFILPKVFGSDMDEQTEFGKIIESLVDFKHNILQDCLIKSGSVAELTTTTNKVDEDDVTVSLKRSTELLSRLHSASAEFETVVADLEFDYDLKTTPPASSEQRVFGSEYRSVRQILPHPNTMSRLDTDQPSSIFDDNSTVGYANNEEVPSPKHLSSMDVTKLDDIIREIDSCVASTTCHTTQDEIKLAIAKVSGELVKILKQMKSIENVDRFKDLRSHDSDAKKIFSLDAIAEMDRIKRTMGTTPLRLSKSQVELKDWQPPADWPKSANRPGSPKLIQTHHNEPKSGRPECGVGDNLDSHQDSSVKTSNLNKPEHNASSATNPSSLKKFKSVQKTASVASTNTEEFESLSRGPASISSTSSMKKSRRKFGLRYRKRKQTPMPVIFMSCDGNGKLKDHNYQISPYFGTFATNNVSVEDRKVSKGTKFIIVSQTPSIGDLMYMCKECHSAPSKHRKCTLSASCEGARNVISIESAAQPSDGSYMSPDTSNKDVHYFSTTYPETSLTADPLPFSNEATGEEITTLLQSSKVCKTMDCATEVMVSADQSTQSPGVVCAEAGVQRKVLLTDRDISTADMFDSNVLPKDLMLSKCVGDDVVLEPPKEEYTSATNIMFVDEDNYSTTKTIENTNVQVCDAKCMKHTNERRGKQKDSSTTSFSVLSQQRSTDEEYYSITCDEIPTKLTIKQGDDSVHMNSKPIDLGGMVRASEDFELDLNIGRFQRSPSKASSYNMVESVMNRIHSTFRRNLGLRVDDSTTSSFQVAKFGCMSPLHDVVTIIDVRAIAMSSILIKWRCECRDSLSGFEIYVNNELKTKVHSAQRTQAVVDFVQEKTVLLICVFGVGPEGRVEPGAKATYRMS